MRLIVLLAALLVAGCQTYQPVPLDLTAHQQAWLDRDPASPQVAAYARSLAEGPATNPSSTGFDPTDGYSLDEARVIGLFFNPALRTARLRAHVPAATAAEAGRWQDPVLRIDAERIISSVANPWVVGGLLDVTLPLSGTLPLERSHLLAEADVAWAEALLQEHQLVAELDRAWIDLHQARQRQTLTQAYLTDLDRVAQQADRLLKAGEMSPLEVGLFRIERARRQSELRLLEATIADHTLAIKALMGLTPEADVQLTVALPVDDVESAPDGSPSRREQVLSLHPKLFVARRQYDAAERKLELEVRRQFPDLTLAGGFGRDEGTSRILGGLGVPIPIFNANRGPIAEARARRDAARAAAEADCEALVSALARAESAAASAAKHRRAFEQEVAPMIDEQMRSARDLGRLGDTSPVVYFETLSLAHETRLAILDAVGADAVARSRRRELLRPVTPVRRQRLESR